MSNDFYKSFILPYSGIIVKICRAYTDNQEDFEDYYQEVSLQIWKSRNNFSDRSKWSTWVYRVSLNVCLTLMKKKNKQEIPLESYSQNFIQSDDQQIFKNEMLNELYSAIKQLKEIDRAVILLYLEEKSHREIAEIIGTNASNIGTRIARIKERLKLKLDEKII